MLDIWILTAYVVIVGKIKTKDSLLAAIAFGLSTGLTYTRFFTMDLASFCHIVVAMIFILFALPASMRVAVGMLAYSLLHWLVAGEYLIFPGSMVLIDRHAVYATIINIGIMLALLYGSLTYNYSKPPNLGRGWLLDHLRGLDKSQARRRTDKC